jgi:hypothetical protein
MLKTRTLRLAAGFALLACAASASHATTPCSAEALDSASYARAVQTVRALPEILTWSRSHRFPVAYGESMDKQVLLDDHCYWSVSVFANRPERLELWHIFYVGVQGKRLLVQDPVSGEAISLQKWRSRADKSRLA